MIALRKRLLALALLCTLIALAPGAAFASDDWQISISFRSSRGTRAESTLLVGSQPVV